VASPFRLSLALIDFNGEWRPIEDDAYRALVRPGAPLNASDSAVICQAEGAGAVDPTLVWQIDGVDLEAENRTEEWVEEAENGRRIHHLTFPLIANVDLLFDGVELRCSSRQTFADGTVAYESAVVTKVRVEQEPLYAAQEDRKKSGGSVAGLVIAILVVVVIFVALILLCYAQKRKKWCYQTNKRYAADFEAAAEARREEGARVTTNEGTQLLMTVAERGEPNGSAAPMADTEEEVAQREVERLPTPPALAEADVTLDFDRSAVRFADDEDAEGEREEIMESSVSERSPTVEEDSSPITVETTSSTLAPLEMPPPPRAEEEESMTTSFETAASPTSPGPPPPSAPPAEQQNAPEFPQPSPTRLRELVTESPHVLATPGEAWMPPSESEETPPTREPTSSTSRPLSLSMFRSSEGPPSSRGLSESLVTPRRPGVRRTNNYVKRPISVEASEAAATIGGGEALPASVGPETAGEATTVAAEVHRAASRTALGPRPSETSV